MSVASRAKVLFHFGSRILWKVRCDSNLLGHKPLSTFIPDVRDSRPDTEARPSQHDKAREKLGTKKASMWLLNECTGNRRANHAAESSEDTDDAEQRSVQG